MFLTEMREQTLNKAIDSSILVSHARRREGEPEVRNERKSSDAVVFELWRSDTEKPLDREAIT